MTAHAGLGGEAIVLVGGRGTRLQSVVSDVPKPLAPVAGRPFLAWVLDELAASGLQRVILATGYLADQVEAFAGRIWAGMEIACSREGVPLGTGGALRQAATLVRGEGVHVLNGDTYLAYSPAALEAATRERGATIGVALARVDDVARYGAVDVRDGRVAAFREKGDHGPGWINAGTYYFSRAALDLLDGCGERFSLETDVLATQAARGNVAALQDTAHFIDIGVPADFARAQGLFPVAR